MSLKSIKVGLIGTGMISYTYLDNMTKRFDILDVAGCSDIIPEKSAMRAQEFGVRQMTNDEIFSDPEIKIVVNTTYPKSHFAVTKAALEAGKNVQCEKMLATTFEEAKELVELATAKGLRLGAAPDTFLGAGYQTCRKLIDDGFIGVPLMVNAMLSRGYHADAPADQSPISFVLDAGGTIPYDMGGYYIHAMVNMFGPIKRVSGFARPYEGKTYTHPMHPKYKERLSYLSDPTIFQSSLEFESGIYGSLSVCNEGFFGDVPAMTVFGTEGVLLCPDPNTYAGPVMLMRKGDSKYYEIPLTHGYSGMERSFGPPAAPAPGVLSMFAGSRRGIGVADMAWGMTNNRPHRCSAELGLHAIETIHGVIHSSKTGEVYTMTSHPEKPAAIRAGFSGMDVEGCLDD